MSQPDPWLEHYGERRREAPRHSRGRIALLIALPAALVVLAVVLLVTRAQGGWQPPSGLGGFRDCTFDGRLAARCRSLLVPADPADPGGRQIALRVAVIPATRQPERGALFYLEGGPGGAATAAAVAVNEVFARISEYRDLVLVDQRGTGGSDALSCPQQHVPVSDASAVAAYVQRCFARLGSEARLFTSAAAVGDLERVRRALGYGRIDLYGSSYGATLAQLYLRRYPGSVRSAILDGASLLNVPVYELEARNAERALAADLSRCRAQPACRRAFPRTRAELARVLARHPGHAGAWSTAIAELLRSPEGAARVPLLVHDAAAGRPAPLEAAYAELVGPQLDARARLALFWDTVCGESWARFAVGATVRASRGSFFAPALLARARLFRAACAGLPRAGAPGAWTSRVPVLLLAGGADPLDPPANLHGWHQTFPAGRLITVPGLAHGVIAYGCLRLVAARFVARGTAAGLAAGCARDVPLPPFALS